MVQKSQTTRNPKKRKTPNGKGADKDKDEGGSAKSQKRALKQERQSHRKHADAVIESKKIWNKLRQKNNSKDEVRQMMEELMGLIRGKANEIALQHDASRVVQAALQFGNDEQRKEVMEELCKDGNLFELSRNQYAHFVVLKAIKYCEKNDACVKMIVKALKGHIPKLAVQATGSKVIESLFETFPSKSTAILKQEFYGPHFALFAADAVNVNQQIPNLSYHLKNEPDKKEPALNFMRQILNKGIEKSFFGLTFFQELFAEYIANCSPNEVRAIAPSVVDHSVHLLSSKPGTRVVAALASYGTAKDRKRIQKSIKGFTRSALLHSDAYLALLRLVQVTDDTVSTHKNIFNELLNLPDTEEESGKPPLLEIALDDKACKLFLMLLVNDEVSWKKIFDPYELDVMEPNPTVMEGGEKVSTSKKNAETRRQELLQHLQKPLIEMCISNTRELLFSLSGSALIREIYHSFHPEGLVSSIVDICANELEVQESGETTDEEALPLFEDRVGHLAIKNLLLSDLENEEDIKEGSFFAAEFYKKLETQLIDVAKTNRGAFVISALCKVPKVRDSAIKKLKKKTAIIKKLADDGTHKAGYEALLKEIEE